MILTFLNMFDVFYLWIGIGIIFLIVEMFTSTLYGLSLSISAFVLALYVSMIHTNGTDILQWVLFAVFSWILCLIFPKWFNAFGKKTELKTGLDVHVGSVVALSKAGDDFKVKIDGVDYLVHEDSITPEFAPRKKVIITGHDAGIIKVELSSKK